MHIRFIFLCLFIIAAKLFPQDALKSDINSQLNISGISVTIGGSFIVNGTYSAYPGERVDQFITRIFNQARLQNATILRENALNVLDELVLDNFAKRNIHLRRTPSQEIIVDLQKFRLTGDFRLNPYLKNDDIIIFPNLDMERNFVSIEGAVNKPTKFQYVDGDKLSDAIIFAQGINSAYQNVDRVSVTRLSYDGETEEIFDLDINSVFELQPGDRVKVQAIETSRRDFRVLVLGEVNRPGYIAIAKTKTTVQEVINKAGGFKSSADIANAELIRETDSNSLYKKDLLTRRFEQGGQYHPGDDNKSDLNKITDELLMRRMSYLVEEDTTYFNIDNNLRLLKGNGLVDFTKLDSDTSVSSNFFVRDGDVIFVPEKKDVVFVFGQVETPGYIKYREGKDVNYYIQQAGGLGELAKDIDEVSIIKAKSRAWSTVKNDHIIIEPGDYIWVPKETPRTFSFYLQRVSAVSSVVGSIATIVLLLTQLRK